MKDQLWKLIFYACNIHSAHINIKYNTKTMQKFRITQ